MRRALLLVPTLLLACGGDRTGGGVVIRADAGGFLDASSGPAPDGSTTNADGGSTFFDGGFTPGDGGSTTPDAGMMAVPLTVQDLQDVTRPNHPGVGARVRVDNVVVTSLYTFGDQAGSFHVQMPGGGPYSGVLVFIPTGVVAPTVAIGDRVTVVGLLEEFFDLTEIKFESLVSRAPGTPLMPEIVTPDSLATGSPTAEAYEGVLVRVQNVQVTSSNPDAPDDFGEFEVTGGLRIDNAIYQLDPRPPAFATVEFIIGVHHYAFSNFKLLPRNAADIGPIF